MEGIIFIILSAVNVREAIFNAIPANMKKSSKRWYRYVYRIHRLAECRCCHQHPSTCVSLGDVKTVPVALALIGTIHHTGAGDQKGKGRTSGWYPDYMDSGYHLPACRGFMWLMWKQAYIP